jgi:hypothetical protein
MILWVQSWKSWVVVSGGSKLPRSSLVGTGQPDGCGGGVKHRCLLMESFIA